MLFVYIVHFIGLIMTQLIDGQKLAESIRNKVALRVRAMNTAPGLVVVLVGHDPASETYVRLKGLACQEVGINFELHCFEESASTEEIIELIKKLNNNPKVQGILVQLPLPNQDTNEIIAAIDPNKDVDGFHKTNIERLKEGKPAIASAVALGVMKLLESTHVNPAGKKAAIVSSVLFAEPILYLMKDRGIEAEVISPKSELDLISFDIVVVAVGKPGLITGKMIKQGSIIIDVGTTRVGKRIVGDVDAISTEGIAGFLSPVPGGVGPMTIAMLLLNVLKAAFLQK